MAAQYTIGIDLGGTYIKGGVCDAQGKLIHKDELTTEADRGPDHVIGRMHELTQKLIAHEKLRDEQIGAVGIGAPGPMSHAKGLIYSAPNLPGFVNIPLRDRFHDLSGFRVVLENDANAAAFGEFTAGAGKDVRHMVMFTLGTGIGGGIVIDGRLIRGAYDNAGELGHTLVAPDGRWCPCGQRGCLERYASAAAIAIRLREAIAGGADSILKPRVLAGEELDARHVLEARAAADPLAAQLWDETCYYLAVAVVNIQHTTNPELVVFAGGLINAGPVLVETVRGHFERLRWKIAPDAPRIALATLGTEAGTIGAAMLARAE